MSCVETKDHWHAKELGSADQFVSWCKVQYASRKRTSEKVKVGRLGTRGRRTTSRENEELWGVEQDYAEIEQGTRWRHNAATGKS
eukprot:5720647-Pleurochrysis_carterae.AAC.3